MIIGAAVKAAMAEAGLTQGDVAELLSSDQGRVVDQGRVSLLIRGQRGARFKADEVLAIERACGLPAGEIFRRVDAELSISEVVDLDSRRPAAAEPRAAGTREGTKNPDPHLADNGRHRPRPPEPDEGP